MKKLATKRRKPQGRKRSGGLKDALFRDVDIDLLRWLLANESSSAEDDLEDMIADVLSAEPDEIDDMPSADTLSELDVALNQTRLDAAGGEASARLTLKNIHAMIDEAAARDAIHPAVLMALGRSFATAQIEMGDGAREAMGRALNLDGFPAFAEEAYRAFLEPLLSASRSGPFELNEEIGAAMSIFPLQCKSAFIERLAAGASTLAPRTAVGFLLHREEPLAAATIRGFGAVHGELDDECRRSIETVRPWLAPARQIAIDAALPSSGGVAPRRAANVIKTVASVCDGSGVSFLLATLRGNSRFLVASVMVKPKGVADCMCYEDLSKSEAAEIERALRSTALPSEVSLAWWNDCSELALGCDVECDEPPPSRSYRSPRRSASIRSRPIPRRPPRSSVWRWPTSPTAIKQTGSARRMNSWRGPNSPSTGSRLARTWRRCWEWRARPAKPPTCARRLSARPPSFLGSRMRAIVPGFERGRWLARRDLEAPRAGRPRNSQRGSGERRSADAADRGEERSRLFYAADRAAGGGLKCARRGLGAARVWRHRLSASA